MNLKKIILKNFRCYDNLEIEFDHLNAFIGKNDIGKSTILEALDIFFNSKPSKLDIRIGSVGPMELVCVFDNLPDEVILDDTAKTSFKEEFLLNDDGDLEIIKRYSNPTLTEKIFIKCMHPTAPEVSELLNLKLPSLKVMAGTLQVDLEDVNKRVNKEIRQAIRSQFPSAIALQEIQVEGGLNAEDNRKKIYASLQKYLPIYSLFKVDKELTDGDEDVQNPMKTVISKVLKDEEIFAMLEIIKERVKEDSTKEADRIVEKLKEIDEQLAQNLKSTFSKEPAWNTIFKLNLENELGIPLNNRGSGIRRLVLLSFFRAQIDKARFENSNSPNVIYALEEPETSQHPNHQLLIIKSLIELSQSDNSQSFIYNT
ncbi:ATP-binding protein [Flavobacterium sp. YO64]|uniref:ATP-binding protein n=1 Tax=Flavobacterium sp. YO64 TaxID=394559 RepID=UPI00100BB9EA|nr:ATP-binding protein [Flavobacterium sp. YO64]RXM46144.1 hypothetical protein BOW57_03350 [Flavobacterium sp. YO64]